MPVRKHQSQTRSYTSLPGNSLVTTSKLEIFVHVPRLRFYLTAPIQDLPVQVSHIHLVRFPQPPTCLFRAPVLSKFTFSVLMEWFWERLCVLQTSTRSPSTAQAHCFLGIHGLPAFQVGKGLLCYFPMAHSLQWGGGSPLHRAGPRSLCHPGKQQELAIVLHLLAFLTGWLPRAVTVHWWKSSGQGSGARSDEKTLSKGKKKHPSMTKFFPMDA